MDYALRRDPLRSIADQTIDEMLSEQQSSNRPSGRSGASDTPNSRPPRTRLVSLASSSAGRCHMYDIDKQIVTYKVGLTRSQGY